MADTEDNEQMDLLWGVQAIARFIGQTDRATYHLLATGRLPARKCGKWVASRKVLRAHLEGSAAA